MLRTLTFTAAMGLALALLPLAPAAASTTWVVDDDGAATTTDCSATAPTHRRISTAIAAAAAGDAVKVCPGTYVEDVILDKTVRLTGPFAGVDARTRSGQGEAVITGVAGNGSPTVQITGRKAALDGITVRGSAEAPAVRTSSATSGYDIVNARIAGGSSNVELASDGELRSNVLTSVLEGGAHGVVSTNSTRSQVSDNRLHSHTVASVALIGIPTDPVRSAVMVNNRSTDPGLLIARYVSGLRADGNVAAPPAATRANVELTGVRLGFLNGNRLTRGTRGIVTGTRPATRPQAFVCVATRRPPPASRASWWPQLLPIRWWTATPPAPPSAASSSG